MQDEHLMPAVPEVLQPQHQTGYVVEQVAEDHHQAAFFDALGQIVKDRPHRRFALGAGKVHDVTELFQMRRMAAGADEIPHRIVVCRQADGILLLQKPDSGALAAAAWLLVAGLVLFSGSLYALSLTGVRGLGAVTPLGGLAFLAAWAALAWAAWRW